jgi:hypothetical protein
MTATSRQLDLDLDLPHGLLQTAHVYRRCS